MDALIAFADGAGLEEIAEKLQPTKEAAAIALQNLLAAQLPSARPALRVVPPASERTPQESWLESLGVLP